MTQPTAEQMRFTAFPGDLTPVKDEDEAPGKADPDEEDGDG